MDTHSASEDQCINCSMSVLLLSSFLSYGWETCSLALSNENQFISIGIPTGLVLFFLHSSFSLPYESFPAT